jgi:hypothetical protein
VDLLGVVPVDYVVLGAMGLQDAGEGSAAATALGALRWLRLVRGSGCAACAAYVHMNHTTCTADERVIVDE